MGEFKILGISKNPNLIVETAGRMCYMSLDKLGQDTNKFVENLIKRGHESVLEHGYMTVAFTNVSRGLTHELVRHRHTAFSQTSTRYALHKDYSIVYKADTAEEEEFFSRSSKVIQGLISEGIDKKIPNDRLRQIAAIGTKTNIVVTANIREWRHIFNIRTPNAAHWEIRELMRALLMECKHRFPVIFDDIDWDVKKEEETPKVTMIPVESSNIESIGYDAEGNLHVQFLRSGYYVYSGVTPKEFGMLLSAVSVGKHFNQEIKTKFPFEKK